MKPLRTSVDKLIKTRPKRTPGRSNPKFRDWYDRSEGNFLESEPDSRTEEHPRYTKERASLCGRPVRPDGVPDSQGRTLHEIYPDSRTAALVILQVANKFADRTFAEANSIYEGFLKENGASKGSGNGSQRNLFAFCR